MSIEDEVSQRVDEIIKHRTMPVLVLTVPGNPTEAELDAVAAQLKKRGIAGLLLSGVSSAVVMDVDAEKWEAGTLPG